MTLDIQPNSSNTQHSSSRKIKATTEQKVDSNTKQHFIYLFILIYFFGAAKWPSV
jgi:hypothetical protein